MRNLFELFILDIRDSVVIAYSETKEVLEKMLNIFSDPITQMLLVWLIVFVLITCR